MMRRAPILVLALLASALASFQACTSKEVVGVVVGEVRVQPPDATVGVGDSLQLTALVADEHGEVLERARPDWLSSGDSIAVVDADGMVWGLRTGTVDISASFQSHIGTAQITVTPPPVYGFVVIESGGSTVVSEGGGEDELTVVLLSEPVQDVVLEVASSDAGEVVVDSETVRFTPADWSMPRTVTTTGVADGTVDGDQVTEVSLTVGAGSDPSFVGIPPRLVSVTTTDAEAAGFTVTETGGSTSVDEGESTDTLFVQLDGRPQSDVVLALESDDTGEVVLDASTLTFTPSNWDSVRSVTVSGVDDEENDGDQLTLVTISVLDASSDDLWDALPDQAVEVETFDGTLGFSITETDGGTAVDESGTEDTFDVVLLDQPASDVSFSVIVGDPTEVHSDKSSLKFTPSDWDQPKTVKLNGVDDPSVDGAQVSTVTVQVQPGSDPTFVDQEPQQVLVTTTDDDVASLRAEHTRGETRVNEGGGTDRIRVELGARPLSDVTVTITSADVGEVRVEQATLTFTPTNWDDRQNVTVIGVDDDEVDGPTFTEVTVAVAEGSDPAFVGAPSETLLVENEDDEIAHFDILETGGTTIVTEGGSWDTFEVQLLVRPEWNVTIRATSLDEGEVTVSPESITINRSGGWDDPRTFVVTGVDDTLDDGDQVTTILLEVEAPSWDEDYEGARNRTLAVTTIDDDEGPAVGDVSGVDD